MKSLPVKQKSNCKGKGFVPEEMAMAEQLYCGAGRVEITPSEKMAPLLQGLGPQRITGILDPLYVRVILLRNGKEGAMLVSWDLDKAPDHEEFLEALSEKTGIDQDAILYFAIHTHTAPIMGYRPFENQDLSSLPPEEQKAFAEYTEIIKTALLEAAEKAMKTLVPAKIGCGHGSSYINVNRCCSYTLKDGDGNVRRLVETGFNGSGPVSRDVFIIRIETLTGKPIAFFVNYACHNVVMFLHDAGDGGIHISSDMGGCVSMNLEKRFPEAVAIWSSGAAGNLNPIMATQNYFPRVSDGSADLTPFHSLELSKELRDRLAGRHLLDILEADRTIGCSMREAEIRHAVRCITVPEEEQEDSWSRSRIRLRLVTIGDIGLIGVNGELFSTLGEIIIKNAPVQNVAVINHDCSLMLDNPGYILDDETIDLCRRADIVRMPHDGFRAHAGYLPKQLAQKTGELFAEAGIQYGNGRK